MRPIKLKMSAFGPYVEPTTLDFESGLRDEKIFLIHGETGAGKTTILDAMTYALYGETSGKVRDAKDMRSKGVADDVLTEIEFEFALGEKIFKIERAISYHPNRKDNKYETRAALFENGNSIETKDRAVKNKVTELLGFSAEQFRQVVVLPQGEFEKFLSSDADDRQKVLNVLFNSEPYKKIEDALSERAKISAADRDKLKIRREDLEKQLSGMDSSSLPEVAEKFSAAQEKVVALKKISDEAQTKLSDGKILSAKFKNFQTTTSDLKSAQAQLNAAAEKFSAAQAEYQTRKAQESERKELDQQIRDLKEIQSAKKILAEKKSALKKAKASLTEATANFEKFDGLAKRYDARLEELNAEKSKLTGADINFERAKQTLEKAFQRDKILRDISQREAELSMETNKLSAVNEKLKSAQVNLNRLQIVHSAAHLATKLKDGEPCPVCGSREHPAVIAEAIPTVAELRAAENEFNRLTRDSTQQERTVARITERISSQKKSLEDYADVPETVAAKKNHEEWKQKADALADCQRRIKKGEECVRENKSDLEKAIDGKNSATIKAATLANAISETEKKIPEKYLDDDELLDADLTSAQKNFNQLDAAWKDADKNFREADKEKSAREATLNSIKKNFDALQNELKNKTPPDIDSLTEKSNEAGKNYDAALTEKVDLENLLKTLKKFSSELETVKEKLSAAEKIAEMWRGLSDVANATGKGESEMKISFQRYFLSMMFNEVVTEANNRLKKMSGGRYLFQMKDAGKTKAKAAGLNLEILDGYSGAFRPVETLSGGESFLASLALALGLAAVVRNKAGGMQLETIFIDEGFGSLDGKTLDDAISTIVEQSGGRLVGIISHVEELKNQMPVRLEITKSETGATGSKAKFEYGLSRE